MLAAGPSAATAAEFSLTTLLSVRPDPRSSDLTTEAPLYELVTFAARDTTHPNFDDIRVVVSVWGRIDFARFNGGAWGDWDLGLAFVDATMLKRRLRLTVGRQFLVGGVVRPMQIDGLSVTLDVWRGVGISAFGGLPVRAGLDSAREELVYGARLFWRHSVGLEVGASLLHMLDDGKLARLDLGLDAQWALHRRLGLSAYGLLALSERRLAEANVTATWRPVSPVQLSARYARTAPDLLLPRTSLFSVFSEESRDEWGIVLVVSPLPRVRLYGDYALVLHEEGFGHRATAQASVLLGSTGASRVGAEARVLKLPSDGYAMARIFAYHRFPFRVLVTIDAGLYFLEEPVNGEDRSFTSTATVGYNLPSGWQFLIGASAGVTPYFERRFEATTKIVFNPFVGRRRSP